MLPNFMGRMMPAPVNGGFKMDGYWVWCGSVIKGEDNRYHMFASRWTKEYKSMHPGWLLGSEIVRAVSDKPEGPYEFCEVVLPSRGAEYWDGRSTHNPSIMKVGDTYVLYYMGSTHPFDDIDFSRDYDNNDPQTIVARSNKRIGVATSKSIFGPWERKDEPVLNTRPDKFDNFLTSNPAPCALEDDSILMVYKSREYHKRPYTKFLHGKMSLSVAKGPSFDDKLAQLTDRPIFDFPDIEFEDPYIWRDNDGVHMIAKDMIGNICGEKYGGLYAFSKDGIKWDFEKGYLAYSRKVLWDDGVTREMTRMERPCVLIENGKATHLFFATSVSENGKEVDTWNMCIPLK